MKRELTTITLAFSVCALLYVLVAVWSDYRELEQELETANKRIDYLEYREDMAIGHRLLPLYEDWRRK